MTGTEPRQPQPAGPRFDAIILAGGAARRLGGASKPDVEVAGRRLLDYALEATMAARRTVVVGPVGLAVPAHVLLTLEDPPLGGPVAGIAAGMAALASRNVHPGIFDGPVLGNAAQERWVPDDDVAAPDVLLLACDVPGAARAVPRLVQALAATNDAAHEVTARRPIDGVCLVDDANQRQWLVGLYRHAALTTALNELDQTSGIRNAGVRHLLAGLTLLPLPARLGEANDVDTWQDVANHNLGNGN